MSSLAEFKLSVVGKDEYMIDKFHIKTRRMLSFDKSELDLIEESEYTLVDAGKVRIDGVPNDTVLKTMKLLFPPPEVMELSNANDLVVDAKMEMPGLRDYQVDTVGKMLAAKKMIVALDMGLGKTRCLITAMKLSGATKILVVSPASLKSNWIAELTEVWSEASVVEIKTAKNADLIGTATVTIVSYALSVSLVEKLSAAQFQIVGADEAHALKHASSKRAKAFLSITRQSSYIYLLTGTPAQKHCDLYNLLRLLDRVNFKSFFHYQDKRRESTSALYYAERYCDPQVVYGRVKTFDFKRNIRSEELHHITRNMIVRLRKTDVLNLPPLIREHVVVGTVTKKQGAELAEGLSLMDDLPKNQKDMKLLELTRLTADWKRLFVAAYLGEFFADNEDATGIVIFCVHRTMQEAIIEALEKKNVSHVFINGDVKMSERDDRLEAFKKGEVRVAVLTLFTCSTGLNLQSSCHTIYTELTFDSIVVEQSESRSHRMGQENTVVLEYLILEGSTDSMVWRSLCNKHECATQVLDGKKEFVKISNKRKNI